jgi:HAD superfamily hydrolase (TIGR01549 family)
MKLKGFIFDLDGTLLNTLPVCYLGFRKTLRKYLGREYPDEEITTLFGPSEEGIFQKLLPDTWQDALQDYLAVYEQAHQPSVSFPGIEQALKLLTAKKIRLAIVSGKGPGSLDISLRYSGLKEFFELIIAGSEQGATKPAHINHVLQLWNFPPQEVAYIGDTAYDITAAQEVGVYAIGALWAKTADGSQIKRMNPFRAFDTVSDFREWIEDTLLKYPVEE